MMHKAILSMFTCIWLVTTTWACPHSCRCSLDMRGRRVVRCDDGSIKDPIPVMEMAQDTEILVISAPAESSNCLTLGPIFKGLRKLEEIHITESQIPALGAHSFWGLHRLHVLNLTHNHIATLMETNFRGADALRHLDLSHNRIESVPSAVFRHVRHIRTLSLSHNMIPELVPRIFFSLSRLERLDISYNPLGDLQPERFTDVPDLKHLSCAGCGLMSVSNTLFRALSQLQTIDFGNNRLTQVPTGTSVLPNLVTFKLDGNHISFVEKGIISGSPITQLHLAHNRIIRIEESAFVNSSLAKLDISYNRLAHLEPGALDEALVTLHELYISGNSLHVDQLLSVLPRGKELRKLGIGDMGMTRIPAELLKQSRYLHHLNFSANYLTSLPADIIYNAPHLVSLDLSHNSFRGVDATLITAITAARELRVLRLEYNPWHCDVCHVSSLLRWIHDAPDQQSGCDEPRVWTCLKCSGPKGLIGHTLATLPPGDLPHCVSTTPAWPAWGSPSLNAITDDVGHLADEPHFPQEQLKRHNIGLSLGKLFKEDFTLFVMGACALVMFLLVVVIVVVVAYNRHSAYYYTNETDQEKKQKLMKVKKKNTNKSNGKNNNSSPLVVNENVDVTIATIDELSDIAGSQELLESESGNTTIPTTV